MNVGGNSGRFLAGLGGVTGVVQADGEHLAGTGHRREQLRLVERSGWRRRRRPRPKLVPSLVDRLRIRREPPGRCVGDVDDPVAEDDRQPSVVIRELHSASIWLVGLGWIIMTDLWPCKSKSLDRSIFSVQSGGRHEEPEGGTHALVAYHPGRRPRRRRRRRVDRGHVTVTGRLPRRWERRRATTDRRSP